MIKTNIIILFVISCIGSSCNLKTRQDNGYKLVGGIERYSDLSHQLIHPDANIEVLADGFSWSEGPLWVEEINSLLFSDVPENKIYIWNEDKGLSIWLESSGFQNESFVSGEGGSNGLALDQTGMLILAQHGNRQIARMSSEINNPKTSFLSIARDYKGTRFNSPNDLTIHSNGDIYFTDPPYGLADQDEDILKELKFNGVYRVNNGDVYMMVDSLTRPNGIALSPDEKKLYVANSDPERAFWSVFDLDSTGNVINGKVFFDVTSKVGTAPGFPDGMKIHPDGYIYATGPGGVHVFSPEGELIALINTDGFVSNCAFNSDFTMLYMTVDDRLMRVRLK